MTRSDDELLVELRRGEPRAYRAIYDRHGAALLRLACRMLGHRILAVEPQEEEGAVLIRVERSR